MLWERAGASMQPLGHRGHSTNSTSGGLGRGGQELHGLAQSLEALRQVPALSASSLLLRKGMSEGESMVGGRWRRPLLTD